MVTVHRHRRTRHSHRVFVVAAWTLGIVIAGFAVAYGFVFLNRYFFGG